MFSLFVVYSGNAETLWLAILPSVGRPICKTVPIASKNNILPRPRIPPWTPWWQRFKKWLDPLTESGFYQENQSPDSNRCQEWYWAFGAVGNLKILSSPSQFDTEGVKKRYQTRVGSGGCRYLTANPP